MLKAGRCFGLYKAHKNMIILKNFLKITLLSISLISSAVVTAKTITVVDEQGRPFIDAVISVAAAAVEESSPSAPPQQPAIMDQVNRQFEPTMLVIEQGQTVVFPNSDNIRHHVYSFSQPKPFEIKLYAGDSVPPVQFSKSGIVVLGCNDDAFHPRILECFGPLAAIQFSGVKLGRTFTPGAPFHVRKCIHIKMDEGIEFQFLPIQLPLVRNWIDRLRWHNHPCLAANYKTGD